MMIKLIKLILLALSLLSGPLAAKDFKRSKTIYAIETEGQVYKIDLAERTALIGGFEYYFGDPYQNNMPTITFLGGSEGVLEMMYVGMRVKVLFADYGHMRLAMKVDQVNQIPGWDVGKVHVPGKK